MRFAPWRSIRGRLLLLALLVEAVMLALLVTNSLRLLRDSMGEQARGHAEQISPVLKAALVAPLAQSDQATVQAVLDESKAVQGIDYLAVTDNTGSVVAISGWPAGQPLPNPDQAFVIDPDETPPRYDVVQPIYLAGQQLGTLHFGLDLTRIVEARRSLLRQGLAIAGVELLLSAALLTLLGLLITRQLSLLTQASNEVANGNATPPPVPEGDDDVGRLGAAFNAMSRAVTERIDQISHARDEAAQLLSAVEQEHARLAALLAAMEFGVLFTDKDDRVFYANRMLERQWQLPDARIEVGSHLDELTAQFVARVVDPGAWQRDVVWASATETEFALRDGRVLTLHRRPVLGAGDAVLGQLWLFADVTAERQAERQLLAAKEAAEAASVAKASFLATMSHEIRTPMNGIIGMTELALDTQLDGEQREFVQTIRSSADTLLAIVNDVLDFSKIEAGHVRLEHIEFDPGRLVGDLVTLFQVNANEREIVLQWVPSPQLPARVVGDPTRLRQVLSNLITNAIKFTRKGAVTVAVEHCEAHGEQLRCTFAVTDSGIGIAADKLAMIFEPFTQADHTTTRKYGGTGLGLAIVKRLVEAMGGQIDAESRPGQGSTFRFDVLLGKAARPEIPSPVPPAVSHRPLRILVAEDNAVNQRVAQALLAKAGHQVVLAGNGAEAVVTYDTAGPFHVVLMDMQMPEMDGLEATRRIRQLEAERGSPATPIVALTANASASDRTACLAAGMNDFLAKPFRSDDMLAMLRRFAG